MGYNVRGIILTCHFCGKQNIRSRQTDEYEMNLIKFTTGLYMQIFPINMKGAAGSLVTLVSWLGSWIISYAFNFLLVWNSYGKQHRHSEDSFAQSGSSSITHWCHQNFMHLQLLTMYLCIPCPECRNVLHLCNRLWPHGCVCGAVSAGNQRKNPRRDSGPWTRP